jgi:hypothetical protein
VVLGPLFVRESRVHASRDSFLRRVHAQGITAATAQK